MMKDMTDPQDPEGLRLALAEAQGRAQGLEERLRDLRGQMDAVSEAMYIQAADGTFLDVNKGAVRMYGYPRSYFIGKTPAFISAPGLNDLEAVGQCFAQALQGTPGGFEFWGLRKNGEAFPKAVRLYPGQDHGRPVVIAIARDITEQKRAERNQHALFQIAEAALESKDTQELFTRVHAIIRTLLPAENLYFALWDRGANTISFPYWVDQVDPRPEPRPLRRGLTEYIFHHGTPLLLDDAALAQLDGSGEIERMGSPSLDWLGVPLKGRSGVFGALVIQSYEGGHHYTPEERNLLVFVSSQVALAIDRSQSMEKQRLLTEAMDRSLEAIFGINEAGRFVFVNRAACLTLGYTAEELLALSIWDIDPQVTPESWPGRWKHLQDKGSRQTESTHQRKDGSRLPVELLSSLLQFEGQALVFTHARNLSERKAAEQTLRASEEKFSRAFQASPDAININRLDGTYLDVNQAFTRMSGWTRDEVLDKSTLDIRIWADLADRERMQRQLKEQGHFVGLEAPFRMKNGAIRTGLVSGTLLTVDGQPSLLTITRDITERKEMEDALRQAEQRLRTVLANSQAVIYQLDAEGRFTLSEGLALANLGLRPGEVVGLSALDLYHDNPDVLGQIRGALGGQPSRQILKQGGRVFDSLLTPVLDENGTVTSIIGIATDITERQLAEDALLAERGLFVGGPVMVIKWRGGPGWPVEYVSPNVETILGYSALDLLDGNIRFEDLVHADDLPRLRRESEEHKAAGTRQYEQQYRLRTAAGEYRWFYDFSAAADPGPHPNRFLGYLLDITDRHNAEEALRHGQKLESLGVLAGGIAHDFNNLLTVILGNLNLAQMKLGDHSPARNYLANTEAAVLRATELTKQMLAYSGRGAFQVEAHDLNGIIQEVARLLEVSIPKKVRLRYDLDPDLPAIQADGAQLQQVVMNLVINAADAIGDREGAIHLRTHPMDLDASHLAMDFLGAPLSPGKFVVMEVEDTGAGMSPEVRARIFDPFFTTKPKGRGLGLSAMLGIIRGHRGGLQVHTEPGHGTSFQLFFPASAEAPQAASPEPENPVGKKLQGRVLIVDDEPLILDTLQNALTALGLEVVTAQDGVEALERFRRESGYLRLVIMDLTMPRMDGREAFQAMYELNPAIPVLLSSGYSEQDSLRTFSGQAPAGFIQKPYQVGILKDLLSRVLKN